MLCYSSIDVVKKRPLSQMNENNDENVTKEHLAKRPKIVANISGSKIQTTPLSNIFEGTKIMFYAIESDEKKESLRNSILAYVCDRFLKENYRYMTNL